MAKILCITPNTLVDFISSSPFEQGRINRTDGFRAIAGGKGINAGRVLAKLGHEVSALGFAGGHTGDFFTELVAADGMVPHMITTKARTRVGFETISSSEVTAVLENGFGVSHDECAEFLREASDLVFASDLVLIGGSVPHENANDLIRNILKDCMDSRVPCWIDSYGSAMEHALSGGLAPDLTKPNAEEFKSFRGFEHSKELHITDGPRTMRVTTPEGDFEVIPPEIKEVSAVGSGDCYLAALAHARLNRLPIEEQLKYAAAAGAANAALGANTFIDAEDIEKYVKTVRVTKR